MPIEFDPQRVQLSGKVRLEEAEPLREWLHQHPACEMDLSACTQFHTGILQVILARAGRISALPNDAALATWLSHYKEIISQS